MKNILSLILFTTLFGSCSSNDEPNFEPQTEADILKYIDENGLNAEKSNTGLYYVIENEGSGEKPTSTSNVTVAYKAIF